jgi:hypothetical protein
LSGTPRQKERPCPVTDAFLDAINHVAAGRLIECGTDGLAQARADELADELFADTEYLRHGDLGWRAVRVPGNAAWRASALELTTARGGQIDPRPPTRR